MKIANFSSKSPELDSFGTIANKHRVQTFLRSPSTDDNGRALPGEQPGGFIAQSAARAHVMTATFFAMLLLIRNYPVLLMDSRVFHIAYPGLLYSFTELLTILLPRPSQPNPGV
jgi:hypothetical protein